MSSRYAAARPKRAGEEYVRNHQYDEEDGPAKKLKFDIRNPSALAPDARDEDAVLDADVIGTGRATKRGAVNLEGYDSDSENEGFDGRAEERGKGKSGDPSLFDQLDQYNANGDSKAKKNDDDDEDMFAELEEDFGGKEPTTGAKTGKKKTVSFLEEHEIEGQVSSSRSGGHVSADFRPDTKGKGRAHAMDADEESSDDEEDAALAAEEEGVDEEVGAGGLKRNAPKVDAFNMKAEQEEGRFDAAGNYVRKAVDPDARHDAWMDGVSKKEMKRAAAAHEKREAEQRERERQDDAVQLSDILRTLILQLEKGETVLEALARLGKGRQKKKTPKWKMKKQHKEPEHDMDLDTAKQPEDAEEERRKAAVDAITGAADHLLTRGQPEVYEQERELLIRQYARETGEPWVEPDPVAVTADAVTDPQTAKLWEFRWTDGRDGAQQGPFDGSTMVAWQQAGYFTDGVEFRQAGEDEWHRVVDFV